MNARKMFTIVLTAGLLLALGLTSSANAAIAPIVSLSGSNGGDQYANGMGSMIDGSGMNQTDPSDPSTWTFDGNHYSTEWMGWFFPTPAINDKLAWASFDLGESTSLQDLYLFNNNYQGGISGVNEYNLYYADSPTVALPAEPAKNQFSATGLTPQGDYDFSSGGWTLFNTTGTLTAAQADTTVVDLSGVTAQYIAVEILTNHGDTYNGGRVGFEEVAVTAAPEGEPEAPTMSGLFADNITDSTADLGGSLDSLGTGGLADVTLYWGETDGGEVGTAWANEGLLAGRDAGAFSISIPDLTPETTYFYAASAENEGGTSWLAGDPTTFTTEPEPGAELISFQEGVSPTVAYTQDAVYIRQSEPTTNQNGDTDQELIVGFTDDNNELRGLLEFDVSDIAASSTIDSAELVLQTGGGLSSSITINVYEYDFDFDETTATWNAPAAGDGTAGGALGTLLASATFNPTVSGSITFATTAAFQTAVSDALADDGMLELILARDDSSGSGQQRFARFDDETVAPADDRPELLVTYTALEPEAIIIGPGADVGVNSAPDGADRLNVERDPEAMLAGTYSIDSFSYDSSGAGIVTPFLATGSPSTYTTLWVGPDYNAATTGIVTDTYAAGTQTIVLASADDVYAGFYTSGGRVDFVGSGNTDHDNDFSAPTVGSTIDTFSNANLVRE